MKDVPTDFKVSLAALKETLQEVGGRLPRSESSQLLIDLLAHQVDGMEKFYELLINEQGQRTLVDASDFDLLTEKHLAVARFFTTLPKAKEKSVYEVSIVSDFYYILRHHTLEWGG